MPRVKIVNQFFLRSIGEAPQLVQDEAIYGIATGRPAGIKQKGADKFPKHAIPVSEQMSRSAISRDAFDSNI